MTKKKEKRVKLPRICLNMIVRDEAHIIRETLDCVAKYIDYWVISDTGSEDNTIQLIQEYFKKAKIPGEIFQDKWKNFGHNRTLALQHCRGKSQYIWVIDADDVIRGNFKFPEKMDCDCYTLTYGQGFTYHRAQVFRNAPGFNWKYIGVLHEYPDCDRQYERKHIEGDYYVDSRRLGARSKDPDKYKKDALVLEQGLRDEPNNERYMFYLAQSWFDYGDTEKGIECYKKRIAMGGWWEEVYYSYYRIAQGLTLLKRPWEEIEQAYMDAFKYCKDRSEPLYQIAMHYRLQNDFKMAYEIAKRASKIPYPEHCILFIYRDIYDYKILDELSIDAYYIGRYAECYNICQKLLSIEGVPEEMKPRIRQNMDYAQNMMQSQKQRACVVYVGYSFVGYDPVLTSLVDNLKESFQVFVVGDHVPRDQPDVHYMNCNQFDKYRVGIDPYLTFLYDNVNYLLKYKTDATIIMVQLDEQFKLTFSNGLRVNLTNDRIVANILNKVTSVICYDEALYDVLKSDLNLGNSVICLETTGVNDFTMFGEDKIKIEPKIENKDLEHNGFEYVYPESYEKIMEKRLSQEYYPDMLVDFHFDAIKALPEQPEIIVNLADYYVKTGQSAFSKQFYQKAINLIEDKKKSGDTGYDEYQHLLKVKFAECLSEEGKYEESFNICNNALINETIPESMRENVTKIRDRNIDHLKDNYLIYPKDKIEYLKEKCKQPNNYGVLVSITSCKRIDLFEKTVNSFINCCQDVDLIDRWLCVDDNSSDEDRKQMKKLYPFFTFVFKTETEKGHSKSMNIIYDYAQGYKYLLHMEDDFHFVVPQSYISKASQILEDDNHLGQILFNRNYAEIDYSQIYIKGGLVKHTKDGVRYVEHEYHKDGTVEYRGFLEKYKNAPTNGYWPHFSFRPSLMKVEMLKDVGHFYHTPHFEMQYADEYVSRGWRSAFYDTFSCIHIGKKTWEKSKDNAYDLNQTGQFSIDCETLGVYVLSEKLDHWKKFKEAAKDKLEYFIRQKVDNIQFLSQSQHEVFYKNNFYYRRDIINALVSQYETLWKDMNSEYLMILDEKVKLNDNFVSELTSLVDQIKGQNYEFIVVSYERHEIEKSQTVNRVVQPRGPINGYLISKTGREKLNAWVAEHGMKSQLYEFVGEVLEIYESGYSLFNLNNNVQEEKTYLEIPGYKFYSQMDSRGGDIMYVGNKTPTELKAIAEANPGCIGFNTLGWLKKEIHDEKEFIHLYLSTKIEHGLYVKEVAKEPEQTSETVQEKQNDHQENLVLATE